MSPKLVTLMLNVVAPPRQGLRGFEEKSFWRWSLVDVFENVRRVHEDSDGTDRRDDEEDVELQPGVNVKNFVFFFADDKA